MGKGVAVELRIGKGMRYVPDIDDDIDFVSAQHFDKIQQCAPGMSNGVKAVGHGSRASVAEEGRCLHHVSLRLDGVPQCRSDYTACVSWDFWRLVNSLGISQIGVLR